MMDPNEFEWECPLCGMDDEHGEWPNPFPEGVTLPINEDHKAALLRKLLYIVENWDGPANAKDALFFWQYGELPDEDDERILDVQLALIRMAHAIANGEPVADVPSILIYIGDLFACYKKQVKGVSDEEIFGGLDAPLPNSGFDPRNSDGTGPSDLRVDGTDNRKPS